MFMAKLAIMQKIMNGINAGLLQYHLVALIAVAIMEAGNSVVNMNATIPAYAFCMLVFALKNNTIVPRATGGKPII